MRMQSTTHYIENASVFINGMSHNIHAMIRLIASVLSPGPRAYTHIYIYTKGQCYNEVNRPCIHKYKHSTLIKSYRSSLNSRKAKLNVCVRKLIVHQSGRTYTAERHSRHHRIHFDDSAVVK